MSRYPHNKTEFPPIELKLGIKSSLPNAAQAISLIYLLWKTNPHSIVCSYSTQIDRHIEISQSCFQRIVDFLNQNGINVSQADLKAVINNNPLLKSQIEHLKVAFELIWPLCIFDFVENRSFSSERDGNVRFEKKISFTSNVDILDSLFESNKDVYIRIIYAWLISTSLRSGDETLEALLKRLLTCYSENALYQIRNNNSNIIFRNYEMYNAILDDSGANLKGEKANNGPLRILCSSIKEGLNYYVEEGENSIAIKNESISAEAFSAYCNRVENLLKISKKSINGLSDDDIEEPIEEVLDENAEKTFTPSQIIYYGVPGCGKSHTVDEEINKAINEYNEEKTDDDKISYEDQVTRVVFHPDYGNADFIGQIMPKIRECGGVDYIFKPGPFSQILRKAYLNSSKPYFLVIEEINRGNAAAIFGEMFQLLDRIKDNKKDKSEYGPGWSSYSILNDDVNDYIRDIKAYEKSDHSGCVKPNHPKDMLDGNGNPVDSPDANGKKEIDFSTATSFCSLELILQGFDSPQIFRESTAIRLPPNLSIYATMNTSDQNVFTLDNAFQRRWEMKQVPNKLRNSLPENATEEQKKELEAEIEQYNEYIGGTKEEGGTGVKWGIFRDEINKIIMRSAEDNGLSSMEDKRLGGWFIVPKKPDEKEDSKAVITKQAFAEKVLKYLWDDAFKFDRNSHFNFNKDEEPTLEKLIENFETKEFEIFVDPQIRELQKKTSPGDSAQDAALEE